MNIDTKISSRQIYLSSSSADRYNNNNNADSMWFFKDTITVPESINVMVSVIDAQIPLTFYSIAEGRNQLKFNVTPPDINETQTHTLDVSDGNYSIMELLEVVNGHPGFSENNINLTLQKFLMLSCISNSLKFLFLLPIRPLSI